MPFQMLQATFRVLLIVNTEKEITNKDVYFTLIYFLL